MNKVTFIFALILLPILSIAQTPDGLVGISSSYLWDTKKKYATKGMYVGVTSIDSLIDTAFASHIEKDPSELFKTITQTVESIGAIEAQMWIYSQLSNGEEGIITIEHF